MTIVQKAVLIAGSAAAVIISLLFLTRRKRVTSDSEKESPQRASRESSPTVVLTQSSDEGRKVSVLHHHTELESTPEPEDIVAQTAPRKKLENEYVKGSKHSEQSSGVSLQTDRKVDKVLSNNNKSSLKNNTNNGSDSKRKVIVLQKDSVRNQSDNEKLSSSVNNSDDIAQSIENSLSSERVGIKPEVKENKDSSLNWGSASESQDQAQAQISPTQIQIKTERKPIAEELTQNTIENGLSSQAVAVAQVVAAAQVVKTENEIKVEENGAMSDTAGGDSTQENSGSQPGGAASPEQCQSSDSGVSVHSEPEVSVRERGETEGSEPTVLEFDFPTDYCGMLIGFKGKHIKRLMDRSGTNIAVKKKVYDQAHQIVAIRGRSDQIKHALKMIKEKFPPRKYGHLDFSPSKPEHPVLSPDLMQLSIPQGVAIDVIVSSVVTANHVFLQQPTHPSFHLLQRQNEMMAMCYNQDNTVPELPRPIEAGVICAAPMYNGWFRGQVVQTYPEKDECDIRFVDYGGYMKAQGTTIKQIRRDFTQLPFQAVECYMAHVIPPQGILLIGCFHSKQEFPLDANAVLEQMVQGQVLQAEVVGYECDGVPYVQLYLVNGDQMVFVNRELVNKGVARWIEMH